MDIQINAKPLCTIADEFLPYVYQLLGKHSFTFHLDKSKQILNVINPLHHYQIVLENKGGSGIIPLMQTMSASLKYAGFFVWSIESEQDRDSCFKGWDSGKQSIWLTLQPADGERQEITVYYFLHQMKASRQLANLLLQNIAKYSDLPIQGVSFHWKRGLSYILPQPGQDLNYAGLAYDGFDGMSEEERQQLADGVVGAAMVFFGKKPLMELMKQLRLLEERQVDAGTRLPWPAASEMAAGCRIPEPHAEAPAVNGKAGAEGAVPVPHEPAEERLKEPMQPESSGEEPAEEVKAEPEGTEFIRPNLAEAQQAEAAEPDSGPAASEEPVAAARLARDGNPAEEAARVRGATSAAASIPTEEPQSEQEEAQGSIEGEVSGERDPAAEQEAKPRTTNYSMFLWLQSQSGNRMRRDPERRQQPQPSFFSYVSQLNQAQQSTDKQTKSESFHMLAMDRERSRKP
ncbi:cytosine deaminase [Paenibacillus thiaminolyticus]|uniref:cytosine deaminase n=1 Tax=Paenibacillus thiaminolyticus TaxID=49283 RepID=UPI003D29F69B